MKALDNKSKLISKASGWQSGWPKHSVSTKGGGAALKHLALVNSGTCYKQVTLAVSYNNYEFTF